jgi:alkylation response protein AidB-like acyl-CoA dehydrogenase
MAYDYLAPIADMRFVMSEVLRAPASWQACGALAELDEDTVAAILEEAAKFARDILLPLNAVGDTEGCTRHDDGRVTTPTGYREAYQAFVEAGWPALPCSPDWGGQGLPLLVDAAVREMLIACNHAWEMYPDLLHGAYETIKAYASDELKDRYLPKIVSGEWLAAMGLTEPQAGSDLGLLRTKAEPQADGSLKLTGQKIFISGAIHDLTPNVVHLVLCRLPDAPAGSKGISLALVPTVLPDGTPNAVRCDGIEHKMGIHGSATCALSYEGATGWLVGAPGKGLAAMFLMMNSARLHVGLQGLAHQEIATQNAERQAWDRLQGRAATSGAPGPAAIAHHPAMRHILLRRKAMTEGQRVVAYRAALALDEAAHHEDAERRQAAGSLAALLTPIVKAFCTHHGFYGASEALQVFGGYGYVHEVGIEQTVRDARIAMIYEGTNEIQAIDLLQRKILADGGAALRAWLDEAKAEAQACEDAGLDEFAEGLRAELGRASDALQNVAERIPKDPDLALRVADDVLFGLSHTFLAWAFAASARAAQASAVLSPPQAAAKTATQRYGMQWVIPQSQVHWQRVSDSRLALPELVPV